MPEDIPITVGQTLKRRRQRLKLSLTDIELATKIRGKFLTALESGDYEVLPHNIYSRGFVQHYASYLGLDGAALAKQYIEERGLLVHNSNRTPTLERPRRMVVTIRLAVILGVVLVVAGLLTYLSYQLSSLAAAPHLSLSSPGSDQVVTQATITVKGAVTPGSDVLVDDVPVANDPSGNFQTKIVLQDGINSVRVVATSRLGKSTQLTRSVLARLPQIASPTATVPAATFAGVAVAVRVEKSATSIVVQVDGKQQFSGIFLPGEQMLFQGTNDIKLTTSNAGATSVEITNQNVASKMLSPLGANGEVRVDQDFASTANFP